MKIKVFVGKVLCCKTYHLIHMFLKHNSWETFACHTVMVKNSSEIIKANKHLILFDKLEKTELIFSKHFLIMGDMVLGETTTTIINLKRPIQIVKFVDNWEVAINRYKKPRNNYSQGSRYVWKPRNG